MSYSVVVARSARRELERLPAEVAEQILTKIGSLGSDPRPHGATKIRGTANTWRIRSGDYPVVYEVKDTERIVDIVAVRPRKDAYRPSCRATR